MLWIQPPTMWSLKRPFSWYQGKSYRNKPRILKKAPTAYSPPPGTRRKVSQPKSWSCTDLNAHGTEETEPQPGEMEGWVHLAALQPRTCCHSPADLLLLLAWWAEDTPRGRMPRGWDLELTSGWLWSPHRRPFQAKLWKKKKVMIFTALGGAQSLGFTAWVSELFRLQ